MRFYTILLTFISIFFVSCMNINKYNKNDIIIENEQVRLLIGNDGIVKSLIYKPTNEECLVSGENIPIFTVTQERPYNNEVKLSHPNKRTTYFADTIYREGNNLIVGFEVLPYEAIIKVKETPDYLGFRLEDFIVNPEDYRVLITPPPTSELRILQLPIRNRTHFGEWLNVSWDEDLAINVLATDQYARIDSERRNGYRIMSADAVKDVKLRDVGVALIVSETKDLLDKIAVVEEDFNMPRGVESRRHSQNKLSYYWSSDVNPENLSQHLKYAKMGGFRHIMMYYPSFVTNLGNYELNRWIYPNGEEDLSDMLKDIEKEGIVPGFHFLHTHIARNSDYVTPIPDHRLNMLRYFTLAEALRIDDTEIYIEQNPVECTMADHTRVLKIGTELISYEGFTITQPYKFFGCKRGIDNTTINSQPKGYIFGLLDVTEFGGSSIYIDQNTDLQDEIANKIADIYNLGFKSIYFDGSEGVNDPFWFHIASAQYKIFKRLDPQPIFTEGAAKTHFSWHMLSGGNAFDVFDPKTMKEDARKWPGEQAPRMQEDFTRINFGWLGYFSPDGKSAGTQPDMLEYVTSRAAAWDCPVSMQSNLQVFKEHPRTVDNLEVLRRWEDVRTQNWLTNQQKKMLQNYDQEHILLINEYKKYELQPYEQIKKVARGSKEIRAFVFERNEDLYVVYWHVSGNSNLKLVLDRTDVELFETFGVKKEVVTENDGSIIIPLSNRHFLKARNITKKELINAFVNAEFIN